MKKTESLFDTIYDIIFQIPRGKVATYGQIARYVDFGCDARMVGWALASLDNRREELPVPWQRVVGRGGKISVPGSEQRRLLEKEGIVFDKNGKIDLDRYGWEPIG